MILSIYNSEEDNLFVFLFKGNGTDIMLSILQLVLSYLCLSLVWSIVYLGRFISISNLSTFEFEMKLFLRVWPPRNIEEELIRSEDLQMDFIS